MFKDYRVKKKKDYRVNQRPFGKLMPFQPNDIPDKLKCYLLLNDSRYCHPAKGKVVFEHALSENILSGEIELAEIIIQRMDIFNRHPLRVLVSYVWEWEGGKCVFNPSLPYSKPNKGTSKYFMNTLNFRPSPDYTRLIWPVISYQRFKQTSVRDIFLKSCYQDLFQEQINKFRLWREPTFTRTRVFSINCKMVKIFYLY